MAGYMYILLCSNDTYYTGSTKYLLTRYDQHFNGKGANYTKRYPPVDLCYYEKYFGVDTAFKREKQVQNWSRAKKEALMDGRIKDLQFLSECQNASHCRNVDRSRMAREDSDMIDPNPA
jgi:putative endonuclease